MKAIIFLLICSLTFGQGFLYQVVQAQEGSTTETNSALEPQPFAGDVASVCSDYFTPERVILSAPGQLADVQSGTQLSVGGVIKSVNPVAIAGVSVIAKVLKQEGEVPNAETDIAVAQFVAMENIGLGANQETPFTVSWNVPTVLEQGQYYLQYSLYLQNQVTLVGSIAEDTSFLGITSFRVVGVSDDSLVRFQKEGSSLGGSTYDFTLPPTFERNDVIQAQAVIENPTAVEKTVTVQWFQYANHSLNEANLRYIDTQSITIPAGETATVEYDVVGQLESKTHLYATLQDGDVIQMLNLPFIRTGGFEALMPFVGLTNFPPKNGEPVSVVACATAPYTTPLPDATVELKLLDGAGTVLSEYSQTSILLDDVNAFTKEFTPSSDLTTLSVQAKLLLGGGEVQSFAIPFSCDSFAPEVCNLPPADESAAESDSFGFSTMQLIVLVFGGVIIAVFTGMIVRARRKNSNRVPMIKVPLEDTPRYK